jgi:hypothetical protein
MEVAVSVSVQTADNKDHDLLACRRVVVVDFSVWSPTSEWSGMHATQQHSREPVSMTSGEEIGIHVFVNTCVSTATGNSAIDHDRHVLLA